MITEELWLELAGAAVAWLLLINWILIGMAETSVSKDGSVFHQLGRFVWGAGKGHGVSLPISIVFYSKKVGDGVGLGALQFNCLTRSYNFSIVPKGMNVGSQIKKIKGKGGGGMGGISMDKLPPEVQAIVDGLKDAVEKAGGKMEVVKFDVPTAGKKSEGKGKEKKDDEEWGF